MKKLKFILATFFALTILFGANYNCYVCKAEEATENSYVSSALPNDYERAQLVSEVYNGITWTGDVWTEGGKCDNVPKGYVTNVHICSVSTQNALKNSIKVPATINGHKVIEVGDGNENILTVTTFENKVTEVVLPDSLVSIDDNAFKGWDLLKNIKFVKSDDYSLEVEPTNLKYIGVETFKDCEAIEDVALYGDVTYGSSVYESCESLKNVNVKKPSSTGTVTISSNAFKNCKNLEELKFDSEINFMNIGDSAFESCALKNLNFDFQVNIGKYAFANNCFLETAVFNKQTSLGNYAFYNSFYEDMPIEKSVTFNGDEYYSSVNIGENCFYNSTGLSAINFSEKIDYLAVKKYAFGYTSIEKLDFNCDSTYMYEAALTHADELKELEFNSKQSTCFFNSAVIMPWENRNIENIVIKSKYVSVHGYHPFWGLTKLKALTFDKTVENISGTIENYNLNSGNYTDVYLKNPKVKVTLNDKTSHSYTIYGYNYEGDKDSYYYKKTGMYGWKECSDNKDNITCKNIQTKLTVSYDVDGALIDGVTFVEGQSLNLDYITVLQRYADGTVHDNTEDANGAVKIAYHENDPYLGYVLKYGNNEDKDNKKLKAGKNVVEVYYGDLDADVIITAEAKKVEDFSLTYVGEPKIEGQTISKEDFKVTNVTYNDKEVVDEVFDFEVTGTDAKLEKGKTTIQVSYDGVTKEYELEVAEKKITSLEITQRESSVTKYVGDTVAADDFLVTAIYDNGDKIENYIGFSIKNTKLAEEKTELEFIAGDVHVPYIYNAIPVVATNIQVSVNEGATAIEHGEIDKSMLVVTAGLNNGQKIEIPSEEYEFEAYDIVADKVNTITVKYKELSTTFNIKGIPAGICALEVISVQNVTAETPGKTYFIGDTVTKDDLYVTAVYNNGRKLENYKDYSIVQGTLRENVNTVVVALNSDPSIKAACEFKAKDIELEKIEVSYNGGNIPEGSKVNTDDIVVKAYYNNGSVKEIAAENYTIKDYAIVAGVKTTLTVVYNGKEAGFEVKGIAALTATPTPTAEPTATPTAEPTVTPTAEPTATPTAEPTATPTVTPTATKATATKATATVTPTAKPAAGKFTYTIKSGSKKLKLTSQSKKVTYKTYINKKITLKANSTNGSVYYQIVKSGKKVSSKSWKKVNKTITIKSNMKAVIYVKYTLNGKTITQKTNGFVLDTKAPTIKVSKTGKITVKDNLSGVKSIKNGNKAIKNKSTLKQGTHKITVTDKAGNKKTVKVTIK